MFVRKMQMTYQIVQKNEIYILVSKSCIAKQLWTLLNLEEHNEPFFHMRGLWNCKVLCIPAPFKLMII
jgi:hypothetical protein